MVEGSAVTVIFVDGADGSEVARSNLPPDQLPAAFDAGTTVDVGGTAWRVERAEPDTAAQWRASSLLTLTLRRRGPAAVPAGDILYSLPSICDELPPLDASRPAADAFELHEDDWRQVEVVADRLRSQIHAELQAIRAIYDLHAHGAGGLLTGFDAIHVRAQPARPLPGALSLRRVLSALPPPTRRYEGLAFAGETGVAVNSFAVAVGPVTLYGLADGDAVEVLGLDVQPVPDAGLPPGLVPGLRAVFGESGLVIVDWCQCSVVEPASVAAYLNRS